MTGQDNPKDSSEAAPAAYSRYEKVAGCLAACAIGAIVLITVTQVFSRHFFNDSIYWAEEACRALLIWTCFLFAGIAFTRGEMAAVEFVTMSLPDRMQGLVLGIGRLVTVVFLAVLTYYGWLYATQNWMQPVPGLKMLAVSLFGDAAGFPIFWVYVALPIGCAILAVTMLCSAVSLLTRTPRDSNRS